MRVERLYTNLILWQETGKQMKVPLAGIPERLNWHVISL